MRQKYDYTKKNRGKDFPRFPKRFANKMMGSLVLIPSKSGMQQARMIWLPVSRRTRVD